MSRQQNKSFIPHVLCSICNINHNVGMKHIYTVNHQLKLNTILIKSAGKIKEAKKYLYDVQVHDEDWEKDSKFWCYFCEAEVSKHRLNNSFMVNFLGFFHHFANSKHYDAVKVMLKKNRKTSENIEKYCIKKSDLLSFIDKLPEAESKYIKKMECLNQKHISQIKEIELKRRQLFDDVNNNIETDSMNGNTEPPWLQLNNMSSKSSTTKKSHLLSDDTKKIPPWLLPTDDNPCGTKTNNNKIVIGPTLEDLAKHVANKLKKKLPANRIGANFNHKSSTSSKWLPSFGRVWTQGRRKQSEIQYRYLKNKLNEEIK